jgi:hypothetical protein
MFTRHAAIAILDAIEALIGAAEIVISTLVRALQLARRVDLAWQKISSHLARPERPGGLALLRVATALFAAAVFAADTLTPVTVAFANLYAIVVLMASRSSSARGTLLVAGGCAALSMLSYYLTSPVGYSLFSGDGFVNMLISLGVLGLSTCFALQRKYEEKALRENATYWGFPRGRITSRR